MKKNHFLTTVVISALILGLTGCGIESEGSKSKDGSVVLVKLPGNMTTRAIEDQVANNTTAAVFDNAEVFLTTSTGAVVEQHSFSNTEITAGYKRIEQVAASVTNVVVVANIPSGDITAVRALTNINAIKAYPYTIASQNITPSGPGAVPIDNKTLIGFGIYNPTAVDQNPDGHDYKEYDVTLDAITARFEIGAVVAGTGVAQVELVGVWINSFYADGSKAGVTRHPSSASYWGLTATAGVQSTAYGTVALSTPYVPIDYYNAANSGVNLASNSKVYAYHVFAGTNVPHLILLVKGEYSAGHYDGSDKYFLKWYTFTKFFDGGSPITSVDANTIYKVGVGSTGIVINDKDGADLPELEKFDLGIQVAVTAWTAKSVVPGV